MDPEIVLLLTQLMEIDVQVDTAEQCEQPPAAAIDGPGVVATDTLFAGVPGQAELKDREPMVLSHADQADDSSADGQFAAMLMYYHLVGCGLTDRKSERDRRHEEDEENDRDESNDS